MLSADDSSLTPDGQSSSLGSLDVPSPPPPVGQPLLDPQQQNFFDQFFNMPHDMVPSVDPSHIFDPNMPKDAAMWPAMMPREFTPQMHALPNGSLLSPDANNYYESHVPSASSMGASHIDLNPFTDSHDMMRSQNSHHPMSAAPGLLNFGTDTNFAPNGYHPPAVTAALDKDAEARSKVYSALTRNGSAATTAVNSPAETKDDPDEDCDDEESSLGLGEGGSASSQSGTGVKRRTEDGGDFTPSKSARKSRPRNPEPAKSKSKKKPAQKRDNLTNAQKRENHIHSEQKRRNLIRQGFEELCALVPELKAGGYSKSAVLIQAANYLDDLKKGNGRLRLYLQQLEGTGG